MIDYYEGCEELLYERLEQRYESVPGGPFKVWRDAAPAGGARIVIETRNKSAVLGARGNSF